MTSTTNSQYDKATDALEVAAAFPQSIKDRTVLITGVNKEGIGYGTAEAFASQSPRHLILAGRSLAKVQACIDSLHHQYPAVDIRPLLIDLSSQKSVKAAAKEVLGWSDVPTIDLLINNAGVMRHGADYEGDMPCTEDGLEQMFGTNHIGHFLFTNLIMEKIVAAAKNATKGSTRIINVSSSGTYVSPLRASDLEWKKPSTELPQKEQPNFAMIKGAGIEIKEDTAYVPTVAYGHSKTCNVLFSVGLNERLFEKYGILSLAINPGEVKTELMRNTEPDFLAGIIKRMEGAGRLFWKTQRQGASTTMVAACDPKLELPGEDGHGYYLSDSQIAKAPAWAVDKEDAQKLWQISEDLTGQKIAL